MPSFILVLLACTGPADTDPDTDEAVDNSASCRAVVPYAATAVDWESGNTVPVEGVEVEFFDGDVIEGTPDRTVTADDQGALTTEITTCTPFATRVRANVNRGIVETRQYHAVLAHDVAVEGTVPVVYETTYRIIPSLLGISIDDSAGMVVGRVLDAEGDPVEGLTVETGTGEVKYFVDEFPNRDQEGTSADGMFVVVNASPGDVDIIVKDGDAEYARSTVDVVAEGMSLLDVGPDGVYVPASCAGPCE